MCEAPSVEQYAGGQVAPLLSVVKTKHIFTNNNNSKLVDNEQRLQHSPLSIERNLSNSAQKVTSGGSWCAGDM